MERSYMHTPERNVALVSAQACCNGERFLRGLALNRTRRGDAACPARVVDGALLGPTAAPGVASYPQSSVPIPTLKVSWSFGAPA